MDDTKYSNRFVFDSRIPPDYIERRKQSIREDVWIKVLHEVVLKPEHRGKYVVANLTEDTWPVSSDEFVYEVHAIVSLAHERHIELVSYEALPLRTLSLTAMGELKYRIRTKWHKFWNTERVKRG